MHRLLIIPFAVTLAFPQKIENRTADRSKIIRLATALNHLSVIEVREPVVQVAAGSSSFKVEWRENRVFVSPLEPDAQTNLFIWTASGRHTYELVTTLKIDDAVFAVDHEAPPPAAKVSPPAPELSASSVPKIPVEMLLEATPISVTGPSKQRRSVRIVLKDLFRKDGKVYVRYALVNDGRREYLTGVPAVLQLESPRSATSLIPLANAQLAEGNDLSYRAEVPLPLHHAESAATVPPGSTAYGIVAFEMPAAPLRGERSVLKLDLPRDGSAEVSALLVM